MKEIICKCTDCKYNGEMTCLSTKQIINKEKKCTSYKEKYRNKSKYND